MASNLTAQIGALYNSGTATGLTDRQLLERFATRRDAAAELAFATLVERHGPMVLRACQGILRDDHEALDAFQATFLVLARKGRSRSLWVRDSLAPWLHRVACRAAGRARHAAARRRTVEKTAAALALAQSRTSRDDSPELASLLHEEVNRLPHPFRAAVVLCDLEGRSCQEAAHLLDCPVGTLASRLARGRQRLRDRLRRLGLAPEPALLAAIPKTPLPPSLIDATTLSAVRFLSTQTIHQGSAAATKLALEVLSSMTIARTLKIALVLLALTSSTTAVVSLALAARQAPSPEAENQPKAPFAAPNAAIDDPPSVPKPAKPESVLNEVGKLEASTTTDVYYKLRHNTRILSILPDGARVTKGQLVCELDNDGLNETLDNQVPLTKAAESASNLAKLDLEIAETSLKEFEQGGFPLDLKNAKTEIALAESGITKAEERLKRTQSARDSLSAILAKQGGPKTPADVVAGLDLDDRLASAEQALSRENFSLDIARSKQDSLLKFAKAKTIQQLRKEIEKARGLLSTKQAAYEREQSRENSLKRGIADLHILAPADGMIVLANDPSRPRESAPQISEGATLRERQKIFSVLDLAAPIRVVAQVYESMITQITPGLTVRIKVDAFPSKTFSGVIESIAPLPGPTSFPGFVVSTYTTRVSIKNGFPALLPGMTAKIEIPIDERNPTLYVPVSALVRYDNKDHLAIHREVGIEVDWREVTLGQTKGDRVEIKQGLKPGEIVAFDPARYLNEVQQRKIFLSPPRPKP